MKKQQQELQTLLYAEEQGSGSNSLDPQVALALARATRDVLTAEEEAAKLRILECEQLLETLKDAADDAHARVEDANYQNRTYPLHLRPPKYTCRFTQTEL